jgi:branched-chain amino acid transport system substrate-binding protein
MLRRDFISYATALGAGLCPLFSHGSESGVSDGEILLGSSAVLSGPLGPQIRVFLGGAELAFNAINAQGGVAGRKVKLVSLDDELDASKAVENYNRLLRDHRVFAFFGCVGSATTAAAANLLKMSGAPAVGGFGVSDAARDSVAGHAYFVRASNTRESQALVEHLTTIGINKLSIAHLDTPGGIEVARLMTSAMVSHKLEPKATVSVKSNGADAASAGKLLAESNPQAILIYLAGTVAGEVIKATYQAGAKTMFYGASIVPGDVTAKIVTLQSGGLAISQVVPYPWSNKEDMTREYRRLAEQAQVPVGYASFEGYLNALVMLEALKRVGRGLTRSNLHTALRALKLRLADMDIDFSNGSNTGSRFIEMVRVAADGHLVH